MRKFIFGLLLLVVIAGGAAAQQVAHDIPNKGRAPREPNGVGVLDVRVFDERGNPIHNAKVNLGSNRTDGFFCEAWNTTDEQGVAVLPPIHMGRLKLTVKARGYETQRLTLDASTLGEPVRVTLKRD